ncbi:MAG TPA: phosphate ABC transporter substrate-binding protein [Nitrospirae bacterium]|nr:phosphate ABC transporter substrate-binding protein [Nitrospirota bacterium]
MKKGFLSLVVAFLLVFTNVSYSAEVIVGAGAAPVENVLKPVKDAFEKAAGITLKIIPSGPKIALEDLQKGTVHAAAAGLSFDDWMALMKKEGSEVKNPAELQQVIIGKDSIIVLLHKDNKLAKLTKEQLKGIFTGKIQNWKEVGGKDMPILVVWGKLIPGTNSLFAKVILDGEPFIKDKIEATTAEDVKYNVSSNPEAIGFGPKAIADNTIHVPETPEITRPITLLTKGKPNTQVQKLIDFINGEGQKLIIK